MSLSQEAFLTSSFEEQIRLVEQSIQVSKNEIPKGKRMTDMNKIVHNGSGRDPQNFHHRDQEKQIYSNRSRRFRYSVENCNVPMPPTGLSSPTDTKTNLEISQVGLGKNQDNESKARASMLMSWYMAGYNTGYYDAMKKFKRDSTD